MLHAADHVHIPGHAHPGHRRPDVTHADDAQGLVGQQIAGDVVFEPMALAQPMIGLEEAAAERQHQAEGHLGHGPGPRLRDPHQLQPMLADVVKVEIVRAGAGADQQFQVRRA
jgi:hypothetical protein